jgi:hypothetical protein
MWRWRLGTTVRRILPAVLMSVVYTCVSPDRQVFRMGAAILSARRGCASVSVLSAVGNSLEAVPMREGLDCSKHDWLCFNSAFAIHRQSSTGGLLAPAGNRKSSSQPCGTSVHPGGFSRLLSATRRKRRIAATSNKDHAGEDYLSWLSSQQGNRPIAMIPLDYDK